MRLSTAVSLEDNRFRPKEKGKDALRIVSTICHYVAIGYPHTSHIIVLVITNDV